VVGARPRLTPVAEQGFSVDEAEVVFWGVCPARMAADGSADGARYHEEVWQ
jgi:Fur family transcriptional regulator, stress-responsive regulator